jgi:hypothetical protein
MLANCEDDMAGTMSFASLTDAAAVAMEQSSAQHCEFIVDTFFKNGDSVVKMQQIFCKHFNIACHRKVPCCNTIQLWAENFITSASALKKKPSASVRTVRLPQNTEAVIHKES